jgi:hypothetical protein
MKDLRCRYCQQVFQPSAYHPQQTVCNYPACQRQRQRDYHRRKIASDPVYRQVCLESPRKWRQAHSGYWKQYRQSHPHQVEKNRQQQRFRDQKRQLENLANNNLASRKILSFQVSSHPEPDSSTSCKQHLSTTAPPAGL